MEGLLAALERPRAAFAGKEMFPDLYSKTAALIESVARRHPFIDGNKRASYLIGAAFLHKNGYDLLPKKGEVETFMLWIVTEKPELKEIAAWLKKRSKRRRK
jgi:death-on-curing protein